MRIITGKAKGIRLDTLEGLDTRPTAERTKEAIFSILQFDIEGRVVLDLFTGSGQMGLEELSRGAECAFLVDKSKKAIEIIKKNAQKTKLSDACHIVCEDSVAFLKKHNESTKFDIAFLDPPYATDLINESLFVLADRKLIKNTSYIVCESASFGFLSEKNARSYEIVKEAKYGIAHITILKAAEGVL
ncbi:MAG: 16S rRNA (guanine(966)-N(2))-methyltransferase RsmD [Clostridia bacterium]|nr:16S rRNA (guanine(966)-N(2))-methyltransferase RsmD [Clostridia bacterium]